MPANVLPMLSSRHSRLCHIQGWIIAAFFRPSGKLAYSVTLLCRKGGVHAAYVAPTKDAAERYTERFTRRYLWAGELVPQGELLPIMWE